MTIHRLPRPSGAARPKVLLVDDHPGILHRVSAVLAEDFDVAGAETDARHAIDAVRRIAPDLIVLDINMPGLDGFQAKGELDRVGSRVPVVFLSAAGEDGHAVEAFRRGGHGFVHKSRLRRDLAVALDLALHDRLFVPSLTSLFELVEGDGHAMQLYGDSGSFLDGLAAFLDLALRRGDATCVIGTGEIREGLSRRLGDAGWDLGGASVKTRYLAIDTADTLRRVLRNGHPDPDRVAEVASELDRYRRAVSEGTQSRLTLFGDVASTLIANGNPQAATAIESQWNRATHGLPFLTLCGYSASTLRDCAPEIWSKAFLEHSAVSYSTDL